jgi:hypothetical protein
MRKEVVSPILVKRRDAAAMLSMSIDSFERYVQPQLQLVPVGTMPMVPVGELQRYVDENAQSYGSVGHENS